MATTQYIGSRYVPIFADPIEWSSAKEYEPLTIVTYQGNSYTAKQFVPVGIDIDNESFWALTGNYNAQVEQYRREVASYSESIAQLSDDIDTIGNMLPASDFMEKTVSDDLESIWDFINAGIYETVENTEGLRASTSEYVYVKNDDSYFGSGYPVLFHADPRPNLENFGSYGTIRDDGKCMVPVPMYDSIPAASCNAYELCRVIGGYINNPNLIYGTTNTAIGVNRSNSIDCSTFVQLATWGIPYESSRYSTGEINRLGTIVGNNYPTNPQGGTTRPYGYNTHEMAMFYAQQGRLFRLQKKNLNDYYRKHQLCAGDILFESDIDDEIESKPGENRYYHIHHCLLVLHQYADGILLCAECGGSHSGVVHRFGGVYDPETASVDDCVGNLVLISLNNKNFVVFARPNYSNIISQNSNPSLCSYQQVQVTGELSGTGTSLLFKNIFSKPLKPNTLYSVSIRGKNLPNDYYGYETYITLSFNNIDDNTRNSISLRLFYKLSVWHDEIVGYFITPYFDSDEYICNVGSVVARSTKEAPTPQNNVTFGDVDVCEGYLPTCTIKRRFVKAVNFDSDYMTVSQELQYIDESGFHYYGQFNATQALIDAEGSTAVVGTIDSENGRFTANISRRFFAIFQGGSPIVPLYTTFSQYAKKSRNITMDKRNISSTSSTFYLNFSLIEV